MTDPGARHHLVIVQRATTVVDDHGGETKTWHELTRGYAAIRYGTAQERRDAAQENAIQAASFEFDFTPTLASVRPTDRLYVFSTVWDVSGGVVIGSNRDVHITAIANLDAEVDS